MPVGGKATAARRNRPGARSLELESLAGGGPPAPRTPTGLAEFDRVLGGGLVRGGAVLLGGDPGIGKSTLLLQALGAVAKSGREVIYVSGEEGADQIRDRADRLGLADAPLLLATATSTDAAAGNHRQHAKPGVDRH